MQDTVGRLCGRPLRCGDNSRCRADTTIFLARNTASISRAVEAPECFGSLAQIKANSYEACQRELALKD